jgi:hypothetical protein
VVEINPKPTPKTSRPKKSKMKPISPSQPAGIAWRAYIPTRPETISIDPSNIRRLTSRNSKLPNWLGSVIGKIILMIIQIRPNRLPTIKAIPLDRNSI